MNLSRFLQEKWQSLEYWQYWLFLSRQIGPTTPEYKGYLATQLQRTLGKKNRRLPPRGRRLIDKIAEYIDLTCCDVLCVGCRNIAELEYFRRKGAQHVVGIDLYSEDESIKVMDMHHMTFPDNHFDVIYSSHSLEHAYDVAQLVGEISRVARSGALVAIEIPVGYQPRGADLVDFGDAKNLHAVFKPNLKQVMWIDEQPPYSSQNEEGNPVVRTVFSIAKYPFDDPIRP